MAFQQFGRSQPQLPQEDPNMVADGTDTGAPSADASRPVAPGDQGIPDQGDEDTEANEPPTVQQLEDLLGVEIPDSLWEQIQGLIEGKSSGLPLAEKQVEKKASVFQRFGGPK